MELDSSMMQPKVVLDQCDIAKYIKEEKIDYKPRVKRKSVADNFNPWDVFLTFSTFVLIFVDIRGRVTGS